MAEIFVIPQRIDVENAWDGCSIRIDGNGAVTLSTKYKAISSTENASRAHTYIQFTVA